MYRPNDIADSLIHLVGWRQDYYSKNQLDPELTISESGQYFQDIHPMLTLDNVRSIAPDFECKTPRAWDITEPYETGAKCYDESTYICTQENTGKKPSESPEYWEKSDEFSDWLRKKTRASILKAVESLYSNKLASKTLKNLLESRTIFDGTGRMADIILNTNSLVGFEIVPIRANGVTTKINKIGLQLKKNQSDSNSDYSSDFEGVKGSNLAVFELYLYHSSNIQPIKTITLEGNFDGSFQWFPVDIVLPYQSANDSGGSWYIVYTQTESLQAINKSKDWSKAPCRCNPREFEAWQMWSRHLEFHPFKVPVPKDNELWDIENNVYAYDTNWGMNFDISIECDLSDFIVNHKQSFQNIIALQVASDMLREMAYNPSFRLNRTQQNTSRIELLYELDGDSSSEKRSGIDYRLYKAMEAADIDLRGMDRVCLPCGNKGIKYRTT